ncbi:MAG: hypothetical protein U9O54_02250 [Chloroflexota bacterium]|nr:hypothetical protein [Chloroflexota bacterium]
MASVKIDSGICGFHTQVEAESLENYKVKLSIESDCPDIQNLAENLKEVEAFSEISFRRGIPETLQKGQKYCAHAACPVPVGIIKAIEVAAGLALPKNVTFEIEK